MTMRYSTAQPREEVVEDPRGHEVHLHIEQRAKPSDWILRGVLVGVGFALTNALLTLIIGVIS